ncbi:hypothetical protein [Paenibacillus senegalimassiliensis]|nr:hypothetical protein [Paenibacillus senegalimassiliensis]
MERQKAPQKGAFILYVPEGVLALPRETPFTILPGADWLTSTNP